MDFKGAAAEILRYEQLLRLAAIAAQNAISKVRVTGGKPLVRRGVLDFIRKLHQVPGVIPSSRLADGERRRLTGPEIAIGAHQILFKTLRENLDSLLKTIAPARSSLGCPQGMFPGGV